MNKNNNKKNISLKWILFFGMLTIFSMLNHITAASSEHEEEKGDFQIAKQNDDQEQESSSSKTDMKISHESIDVTNGLLREATVAAYENTKQVSNNAIALAVGSQNKLLGMQNAVATASGSSILDQLSTLNAISETNSIIVARDIKSANNVMTSRLQQESEIVKTRLGNLQLAFNTCRGMYKEAELEKMQVQQAKFDQKFAEEERLMTLRKADHDQKMKKRKEKHEHQLQEDKDALNLKGLTAVQNAKEEEQKRLAKRKKDEDILNLKGLKALQTAEKQKRTIAREHLKKQNALNLKGLTAAHEEKEQERQRQTRLKAEADELKEQENQFKLKRLKTNQEENELRLKEERALRQRIAQEQAEAKKSTTYTGDKNDYDTDVSHQVEIYGSGKVDVNFRLIYYKSSKTRFKLEIALKDRFFTLHSFMTPDIELNNLEDISNDYSFYISPQKVKKVNKVEMNFRWPTKPC